MSESKIKTTIKDFELFTRAMKFAESVVEDTKLKFEGNNIHICDMDASRIILFDLALKNILEPPISAEKAIDLTQLIKILNTITMTGEVDVILSKYKIKFKQGDEHFSVTDSNDFDRDDIPLNNLRSIVYEFSKSFSVEDLRDIVNKASLYSDVVDIFYDEQGVKFKSVNKEIGSYSENYGYATKDKKNRKEVCVSLLYVKLMTIPELFPKPITLKLKNNNLLLLKYESATIDFEGYVAPRVAEDKEDKDNE